MAMSSRSDHPCQIHLIFVPIFQVLALMAPKFILQLINKEICQFLWEGRKHSFKKFHLMNCETIKAPKYNGGLWIRDPTLMNKEMEVKLAWKLKHN